MLGHYILTLYRSLTRHRLYAVINVLGLAVGVAVFLVLSIIVREENSYDAWIPGVDSVYLLRLEYERPGSDTQPTYVTPGVVLPLLRQDYPQISSATRWANIGATTAAGQGGPKRVNLNVVDADFGRVFPMPLVSGDLASLKDPAAIAISQSTAQKLYGTDAVLGRDLPLTVDGRAFGFRITAVVKDRPQTSMLNTFELFTRLRPDLVTSVDGALTQWNQSSMMTAIKIGRPSDAAAVSADLVNFLIRRGPHDQLGEHPERGLRPTLEPLRKAHFDTRSSGLRQPVVDPAVVAGMTLLGGATVLLAVVNAINLATARTALRAREVAVRKSSGASRRELFIQFMAEGFAVSLIAVLIGSALTELSLPAVNALLGADLRLNYFGSGGLAGTLAALVVVVAVLSSVYPALVLSSLQPAATLASARAPGGGRSAVRVRAALVCLQFAASIALIVCTAVALDQAAYERRADPGFVRTDLFQVSGGNATDFAARRAPLLDALRATPGVTAVGVSDRGAHNENATSSNIGRPGMVGPQPVLVEETTGGDYLQAYGARLIAGRWFEPARGLDDRRGSKIRADLNVALNRSAARTLGFPSPQAAVGQTLLYGGGTPVRVIGVVEDVRFLGPRNKVNAAFYVRDSNYEHGDAADDWRVAVRYAGVPKAEMQDRLAGVVHRLDPDAALQLEPVTTVLDPYYRPDERRSRLFATGAALAVALSCVGLYGLASFTTARRVREIGIRKTLGASTADILRLLVGQFLRPVLLANLVAWPLAYVAMRSWLSGFDQRIALSPLYFVGATALTLAVALATVIGQALLVARAEPARALRHE